MKALFELVLVGLALLANVSTSYANVDKEVLGVDHAQVSMKNIDLAIYNCGVKLLRNIKEVPYCRSTGSVGRCWSGGSYMSNSSSQKNLSESENQYFRAFGLNVDYELRYPYDYHSDYDLKMQASSSSKMPSPLSLRLEERSESASGSDHLFEVDLETVDALPILSFVIQKIKHCSFDGWGREICEPPEYQYSNLHWVLSDQYQVRSQWRNIKTKVLIEKFADFGQFINCVESDLRAL